MRAQELVRPEAEQIMQCALDRGMQEMLAESQEGIAGTDTLRLRRARDQMIEELELYQANIGEVQIGKPGEKERLQKSGLTKAQSKRYGREEDLLVREKLRNQNRSLGEQKAAAERNVNDIVMGMTAENMLFKLGNDQHVRAW